MFLKVNKVNNNLTGVRQTAGMPGSQNGRIDYIAVEFDGF
jgi:hypothetical protein